MIIDGIIVAAAFSVGAAMVAVIDAIKICRARKVNTFLVNAYCAVTDMLTPEQRIKVSELLRKL